MSRRRAEEASGLNCECKPPHSLLDLLATILAVTTMLFASRQSAPTPGPSGDLRIDAWQEAWNRILAQHVDAGGRIDFTTGLARDRADLNEVVKFIAAIDPRSSPAQFPTSSSRLAYYINAYNALAMYGVLETGIPRRFGGFRRVQFFYLRKFMMGGHRFSLYSLENDIVRPIGDPRVHFALNCMTVGCPRLPRTAFTAIGLDLELDAAACKFLNEVRNVDVDRERKEVRLSAIFRFYIKDFLAHSPDLIGYINHYRTTKVPGDSKVVFADYDWTINDQSRLAGA
jgi:hypothetical protein